MLLALDAGNSNITIGAFEGRELKCQWRLRTVHDQTSDEWGILLRNLFSLEGLNLAQVDGFIVSSVVPMPVAVGDGIGIRQIMKLTLTSDHRLVDGELAARFLNALRRRLQDADAFRGDVLNG